MSGFKLKSGNIKNLFKGVKSKFQKLDSTLQNLGKKKDSTTTTPTTKAPSGGGDIDKEMDWKYGHGEFKSKETRRKPGESKFDYNVRMKKQGRKQGTEVSDRPWLTPDPKTESDLDTQTGDLGIMGTDYTGGFGTDPNDLRPKAVNLGMEGEYDDLSFGEAFQQAKLDGIEVGENFHYQGEKFKFEYKGDGPPKGDDIEVTGDGFKDIDGDGIDDTIQGITSHHKEDISELYPEYKHKKKTKKEVVKEKNKGFNFSGSRDFSSKRKF